MKKALLFSMLGICSLLVNAQLPYSGALTSTDPTFNRPDEGSPPTALSTEGIGVYYDVIPYVVTTAGLVTITSITPSTDFDLYGFLYSPAGFNPASPLSNVLLGDDDTGPGQYNFALTYNFTTPGTYYIVVTSFKPGATGAYTITATEPGPLPVRLISFTAEKSSNSKNLLKFVSAGESDIEQYQVQRSSNGVNFTDLPEASSRAKNLSTTQYYTIADNAPLGGINFYRLKITDRTGIINYSIVAAVSNSRNGSAYLTVFPNPASSYINIQTKNGQKGKAGVTISSAAGQTVYKQDYTIVNGGILYVDVKALSKGTYFIRINTTDGEITTLPFVKR